MNLNIPQKGKNVEELSELIRKVTVETPETADKNFLSLLIGGRIMPAVAADMIVSYFNNTMHTFKSAGIHVLIEDKIIRTLSKKIGFSNGDGIFTPGGSLSNMVGMIVARNKKSKAREKGLDKKLVAYTSDQSHYSISKNANIIGIGRENVRKIATDKKGKMNTDALRKTIQEDKRKRLVPFFINATAGTTVLGAFDPIVEISDIAKESNLWLHIDAALGGTVLLHPKYKHLLDGCEEADSLTWDAHKMMNVPVIASMIFLKERGLLEECFSEQAKYLFQDDNINPGVKSMQCGRRNDAFKVWIALQYCGWRGYEKRMEQQFHLAQYAAELIKRNEKLELLMEPESINVCFKVKGKKSSKICEDLEKQGIRVSYGIFDNEEWIRLVCVNPDLKTEDIDDFLKKCK